MSEAKELVVRLPRELHAKLKQRADAEDRCMAAVLRVALRHYLASTRPVASIEED